MTAKMNVCARNYLRYVLEKMPGHMDDTDRSFPDDMMPWSETYRVYETSEMYNNLHLNLELEEEPPQAKQSTSSHFSMIMCSVALTYKK